MNKNNLAAFEKRGFDSSEQLDKAACFYSSGLVNIKYNYLVKYCKDKDVLDLGCGTGYFTFELINYARKVVGIDFTEKILEKANKKAKKSGNSNVSLIRGDGSKIPLKANQFDVVYCYAALYYVKDVESALIEVNRVLRKGGIALFELGNKYSINTLLVRNSDVISYHISPSKMNKIIKNAGFEIVEHHAFQIFMWSYIPFFRNKVSKIISRKINGKMLDEIISSLPMLRNFAFRHFFVCKKRD